MMGLLLQEGLLSFEFLCHSDKLLSLAGESFSFVGEVFLEFALGGFEESNVPLELKLSLFDFFLFLVGVGEESSFQTQRSLKVNHFLLSLLKFGLTKSTKCFFLLQVSLTKSQDRFSLGKLVFHENDQIVKALLLGFQLRALLSEILSIFFQLQAEATHSFLLGQEFLVLLLQRGTELFHLLSDIGELRVPTCNLLVLLSEELLGGI